MKRNNEQGFTLIELLIVVAIISIIAAIAVPGLLRARMTGNETSAIASLKVTTSSQVAYLASCGNGSYAGTYQILGTPPAGSTEAFISADLGHAAPILKSGYDFDLVMATGGVAGLADCNASPTISAYFATATPQTFGTTGTRHFAVNAGNTIWQDTSDTALPDPLPTVAAGTVSPVQ
jgi:prepilin-type N-terminal cleavage/methylation domain-containing protein